MSARGKKLALIGGGIVFLIILVAVFVVPSLVNVNRYRPQVVAEIEARTGMPARIGRLTLTLFPKLSIRVDNFELDNPAGYPSGYVVKAGRIYATVDADDLLHRKINITSFELDQPDIELVSNGHGGWNYEIQKKSGNGSQDPSASSGSPAFTFGVISKVTISHGNWAMADVLPSGKISAPTVQVSDISCALANVNLSAFGESSSAALYQFQRPADLSASLLQRAESWIFPMAYAADAAEPLVAQGTLDAASLRFGTLKGTSLSSQVRVFAHRVEVNDISLGVAGGKAQGGLGLDFSGANLRYSGSFKLGSVDMAQLLQAFPQASGKMTGTLDGGVKLNGEISQSADPLSTLKGTGQVKVLKGKLPTLQLNKNLMLLARLANMGPAQGDPSSFSSISSDFEIAQGVIHSRDVKIVGNGVDVNGQGSMDLEGAQNLDYSGVALLAAAQNGLTGLLAGLSGATYSNGHLSFPFNLKGTLENPKFILASMSGGKGIQRLLGKSGSGSSSQTPSGLVQGIMGLFGKKKSTQPPQ